MPESMRQVVLARLVECDPQPEDFRLVVVPRPVAGQGEVLLRTLWLSLDPLLRFAIDGSRLTGRVHLAPGNAIYGGTVSEIVASNHPEYMPGEIVEARTGWQEYAVVDPLRADPVRGGLRRIDPAVAPVETALGVLGMPGQTAFDCIRVGAVKPGETVAISAAGGAIGTLAGQIAKAQGARVVGIAGGAAKCAAVRALGFDDCIDYQAPDFAARLARAAPDGIDVYVDNTGGDVTWTVLPLLNRGARMAMCGFIAYYGMGMEGPGPDRLPGLYRTIMSKGLRIESVSGFRAGQAAADQMARWYREGRLVCRDTVIEGLDKAAEAFCAAFRSGNPHIGKVLVKVA